MGERVVSGVGFPLVGKELIQRAARKRTYLLRVVVAVVLVGFGLKEIANWSNDQLFGGAGIRLLGVGEYLFDIVRKLNICLVYVVVPAQLLTAILSERERRSLEILLTSPLLPWDLLLQKYVSGLIPVMSLMLTPLPMLAVAYTLGGIEIQRVYNHYLAALCMMFVVGAIALACSCYALNLVQALIIHVFVVGGFCLLFDWASASSLVWLDVYSWPHLLEEVLLLFVISIVFLMIARGQLLRRAFVTPKPRVWNWMRLQDLWLERWNKSFGGVRWKMKTRRLPEDLPVAWRLRARSPLRQLNYCVRVVLAMTVFTMMLIGVLDWMDENLSVDYEMFIVFGVLAYMLIGTLVVVTRAISVDRVTTTSVPINMYARTPKTMNIS